MREIVLDTETTGVDAESDRIVEIGCVELVNSFPTGRTKQYYINPERPCSRGAFEVHGLSDEFLAKQPVFSAIVEDFCDFVGDARLVIHNASFDVAFLNAEFRRCGKPAIEQHTVVDTLALARRKHTGASNSLDALCQRYGIDNAKRTKHGALLDSELLSEVYIELMGGKQADLALAAVTVTSIVATDGGAVIRAPRPFVSRLTDEERAAHLAFIATLGEKAIWRNYVRGE